MNKYYIYVNAFWNGFVNKTDGNHIGFFEKLFLHTKINNFEITNDINKANVLFESLFGQTLTKSKKWEYKIHYSGEPFKNDVSNYTIVLDSENNTITNTNITNKNNIVDLPLVAYYIHGNNNFYERLLSRTHINKVPSEFCCFVVSSGNSETRNKMFNMLNQYKKVHSYGKFANNMNENLKYNYWTDDYFKFIGKYKFIICFENTKKGTYITEKIVNPYLAGIVPIYWGTHHIKNVFNNESMLFLEDETNSSFINLINKIIELDNDDEKYLKLVNTSVFTTSNLEYWNNNYTIESISKKMDKYLN